MRKSDRAFCNTVGLRPAFRLREHGWSDSLSPGYLDPSKDCAKPKKGSRKMGTGPILRRVAQPRRRVSVIFEWAGKGDGWKRGQTPLQGWKRGQTPLGGRKKGTDPVARKVEGWKRGQTPLVGPKKGDRPGCAESRGMRTGPISWDDGQEESGGILTCREARADYPSFRKMQATPYG